MTSGFCEIRKELAFKTVSLPHPRLKDHVAREGRKKSGADCEMLSSGHGHHTQELTVAGVSCTRPVVYQASHIPAWIGEELMGPPLAETLLDGNSHWRKGTFIAGVATG